MSQFDNKKERAVNPNRRRSLYLANTIFLCCLTLVSLLFALIVYFRLRTRGTDGIRQLYTEGQIRSIEENAAANARNDLLLEIQSSLESGRSTTQMLREIFDDSIVVVSGGRYYFYPLEEDVEKNPLLPGMVYWSEGMILYSGDTQNVRFSRGILLSDDNGKIDWNRLADSEVEEMTITAGILTEDRFTPDQQFERNCRKAVEKGKRISLCLEVTGPAGKEPVSEAVEAIQNMTDLFGIRELPEEEEKGEGSDESGKASGDASQNASETGADNGATTEMAVPEDAADIQIPAAEDAIDPTVVLRIHTAEEFSDDGSDRKAWTSALKYLCNRLKSADLRPVIGAGLYTCAAQIDLSQLAQYDRWLIDHEETASFPYSFSFWEYSVEGDMEGVPGKSVLYVRVSTPDRVEITQGSP